jgi:uncharacterized protein
VVRYGPRRPPIGAFFDSSAWFAAAVRRDADNARAKSILSEEEYLVTADHVILETWTLLSSRYGHHPAERFLEAVRESGVKIETVTLGDFETARVIDESFPDEEFSLADRLSFGVMRRTGLTRVVTFSQAFAAYRYGRDGDKRFELIPTDA